MSLIESVIELKSQGMGEQQIYESLKDQGASPREIADAINQAKIKQVITGEQEQNYMEQTEYPNIPQPEQPQYYPEQYQQQPQYSEVSSANSVEIAEQVFDQKISKTQKELLQMQEFKNIAEIKINNLDERLKRIEEILTMLQSAVLEKVGSYGNTLESIKKEMSMMQDTFSKTIQSRKK